MKDYLVDVPVRICIWIREECQRRQWEVVRQARPSILFLQSDGGRNEEEWKAIRHNRKMIDESIDWNCKVYRFYEEENQGMYAMSEKVCKFIWETVDRCCFLEDDDFPSVSYFRFCADLLEKYKDDPRIECICGMNHLGVSENVTSDYFFSRQGAIWGTAAWRRVETTWNSFDYYKDPYIMGLLRERTKRNPRAWELLKAYGKDKYYDGHVAGGEFWLTLDTYAQNRLQIIPKYNLISNMGDTADSAHASSSDYLHKSLRNVFGIENHELTFPLKEPKYVIPDIEYEKKRNRKVAYNHPLLRLRNRAYQFFCALFHGDFVYIRKKFGNRFRSTAKCTEK